MTRLLAAAMVMGAFASGAGAQDLKGELMALEHKQWVAWSKKDPSVAQAVLTEDAVSIVAGTAPVVGRDAIVKMLPTLQCEVGTFKHHDATLKRVTPDVAIVSYAATQDATCDGKKLPPKVQALAVYVRKGGKWLQTSYQETPIE